jgi:hypothetical protein
MLQKSLFITSVWLCIFMFFSLLLSTNLIAQTQDTTPPSVESFDFTPTAVDTSDQDQTVTATLQITDDLSGLRSGLVYLGSPSGSQNMVWGISLISGDALNGIYQALITIPRFSETGIWQFLYVRLEDFANNVVTLSTSDLVAMGFPTSLMVTTQVAVAIDIKPGSYPNSINPRS